MGEEINNFKNFINRGEIRKQADILLGALASAYLRNNAYDNRSEIKQRLEDINASDINWNKDVVKSVRDKYKQLTSSEVINIHITRSVDDFLR
jgi:hypothetical protein